MDQTKKNDSNFLIAIILTTIFMGSSFPTGKFLISLEHVPPFLMGGWRFLIAGFLMLLWTLMTHGFKALIPESAGNKKKGFVLVAAIGLLQTTGTMGFLNLSMAAGVSSSMSSIILFTNPLWLAIMAHFLLNDKLNRWKVISLVLGISGVIICLGLDSSGVGIGLFFALLGSLCWSVNTVITKKVPFDKGPWLFTAWQLFLGGIFMLILAGFMHENYDPMNISAWGWIWFVWLIIPASVGSFGLWFYSLRQKGATTTSGYLFLVPLFSTIFSVLGLHDKFSIQLVVGGLLVVLSLFFLNKKSTSPR
ncbi:MULTISPECIES: EamA family transporter [Pediococcus]|uniref:DMT family transporter n=1 Tax=Pediococcus TaxID=1253 RepID=UPI000E92F1B9|nr:MULTISPECIES: EamA family transporter [Pediococcus]MCT3028538.1 EamA family transporter [Pediococcus parvulus]HBO47627.1 EamA family transporter [Pediococcus sp.]